MKVANATESRREHHQLMLDWHKTREEFVDDIPVIGRVLSAYELAMQKYHEHMLDAMPGQCSGDYQ